MVVAVPQSMAYAILAGVPPAYGLYTSIVSGIVASLFGSSKHLNTGPTNATSVMFASVLIGYHGGLGPLEVALLFTFLVGLIKFLMGLFRLGKLVYFISDSVIIGFTAGAGVLIAGNQLRAFLGIELDEKTGFFFLDLFKTFTAFGSTHALSFSIAMGTLIGIIALRKIYSKAPASLILTAICGLLVFLFNLESKGISTVGDIGSIPRQFPNLKTFSFDLESIQILLGGSFAVAIIGLMEATAISKAIARRSGQKIDSNREFIAQGLANMVGAFFQNYASSGSFTRTALTYFNGGKTRMAGVFCGILIALVVLLIGPFAEYIPMASLSGMLMVIAFQMIDMNRLKLAWKAGRESAFILLITFFSVLLFKRIDFAIYLGVIASLFFYIRNTSSTRISIMLTSDNEKFREIEFKEAKDENLENQIIIFNISGPVYFGVMDNFLHELKEIFDQKPRAVIFRLRRTHSVDSSVISSLEKICIELNLRKIPLMICGVDDSLMQVFDRCGLSDKIGRENLKPGEDFVFNSVKSAIDKIESD